MQSTRRRITLMAAAALACGPAWAQAAFPTRPVKLINPFPPGSPVDVVARVLAHFGLTP